MTETVEQMESRWAALMAARYGADHPRKGERIYEVDGKYAREVTALGVQISDLKKAAASRPQINQDQLVWLDRVQAAADDKGNRPAQAMTQAGTTLRKNLENARQYVLEGKSLSTGVIESTEAELARQGVKLPTTFARPTGIYRDPDGNHLGDVRLAPPAVDLTAALPQPINTLRGPKV